ncbi:MAG: mechanosensitive ion channel family protein [Methylococcales bacterium]|nr:mechanosensitive ion channel family protein [Methylococcales bacterium]MDP3839671.1 mechanosensitive ion channel family protein [Methylococcales bacterium]
MHTYIDSSALYLTAEELTSLKEVQHFQRSAERALDVSELPPATVDETSRRLMVQLKEVLDHIDIPPMESIPDAQMMAKAEFKYWVIPNSEIRIQRVEKGARTGEYLFTPDTLNRLPEFYAKVKHLPYKANASVGWYDFTTYSPAGVALALNSIIPPRWLLTAPDKQPARTTFLDQPAWRWLGIVVVLGIGFIFVRLCFRLSHYWRIRTNSSEQWADLLRPISLVIVTPIAALIFGEVLRVSSGVYEVFTLSLWTLFYLVLTWTAWVTGGAIATSVIAQERLLTSSIDSQLIRLVLRLITFIVAIAILIAGADRIGLPAYSVLAGLGVGGLAVALAAQQTIANLIGSLIIMIEKPFKVGDSIKLKDTEGVVENVGFRSTRIRTLHNSLVTIPSSQIVSSTIDNMALRDYRQIQVTLNLTYDTPIEKIKAFVEGVKHILESHPDTRKDNIQVFFYQFGAHSLDILVDFFVKVPAKMDELNERQRIFLDILRLAEDMKVEFAFPTQTLYITDLMKENANPSNS